MKLSRYLVIFTAAVCCAALYLSSCAKAEDEFLHADSLILSIEIQPAGGGAGIAGYIDETTGEIHFPIEKKNRDKYDVLNLVVRASVDYDTFIYPSLTGLKDLSEPYSITVTAGNGSWRKYTLWAYYTRR